MGVIRLRGEEGPAPVFTKRCWALGTEDTSVRRLSLGDKCAGDWSEFRDTAVREDASDTATQELRPERHVRGSQTEAWGKMTAGRRDSVCKGPEPGTSSACRRNVKKATGCSERRQHPQLTLL